jgi:hypothetical protein
MSTAKPIIVDMFGLMDQAEYDRRFDQLAAESVLDLSGEVRFLVTLARTHDRDSDDPATPAPQ